MEILFWSTTTFILEVRMPLTDGKRELWWSFAGNSMLWRWWSMLRWWLINPRSKREYMVHTCGQCGSISLIIMLVVLDDHDHDDDDHDHDQSKRREHGLDTCEECGVILLHMHLRQSGLFSGFWNILLLTIIAFKREMWDSDHLMFMQSLPFLFSLCCCRRRRGGWVLEAGHHCYKIWRRVIFE